MLHFYTQRPVEPMTIPTFQKGDEVFLGKGSYQGTIGIFLNLKDDDPKWADILERASQIRLHPVEWLEHAPKQQA